MSDKTIVVIGSRGIPARYGGFETFVEELSVNLVRKHRLRMVVVCDAEQRQANRATKEHEGVQLVYSKYAKTKSPLLFYLDSMALAMRSDSVIYCCGAGGGYWSVLARLRKKLLVTNPDGLEWERGKWPWYGRLLIKSMYYLAARFSDHLVCDSKGVAQVMRERYAHKKIRVIEYGAYENEFIGVSDAYVSGVLEKYGLTRNSYHLVVSRLEPENNLSMIVAGYTMQRRKYPLIVVGNVVENAFVQTLKKSANEQVRFIGGVYEKKELRVIRANATTYLHGHSVGGTNPSLLEALASENLCICHDNVFNREVMEDNGLFFRSETELSERVGQVEQSDRSTFKGMKEGGLNRIRTHYNWEQITKRYFDFFSGL